ncbi:MAG: protein kinase [Acidobacteria bacterium]|nr:protein kinase [Acidobacteriota bacterium]
MRTEDWPLVERMFHDASQLGVAERDEYLARECAGDEGLRREVESLVAAFESNRSFLEEPLLSTGLRALYGGQSESLEGRSLGHYKILRMLDGGGMGGEVYLAEDCRLERPVALKFISNHYAGDEWAREQMMKEARAVARLEHPHICPVYAVEEIDGHHFIVMQYVEGETLASLMRREWIALPRVAEVAEQIAGALAYAHARGVIHRDVKPQNIMVTPGGQAKVLDFGLAKFVRPNRDEGRAGEDPEQTLNLGGVVGTPAYMSPEQTRGEELDSRTDIFSFGVVLYEMLSGRNPFLRDTIDETLSAVRSENPPPLPISPAGAPGALGEIAIECLWKERARRPDSADALAKRLRALQRVVMGRAGAGLSPETVEAPRFPALRRQARALVASALALLLLLSAISGYLYLRRPEVRTLKVSGVPTLAVLPITDASGDVEGATMSVGLTRVLYDKFSYLPQLKLRRPSAAPPGANATDVLLRAGRELKADAVFSGEIIAGRDLLSLLGLRASPRLRLSLLDTANASLLWDATFDLSSADIFALQDDITREVAARLGLRLVGADQALLTKHETDSKEALKFYMLGRNVWSLKRNGENTQEAIRLFEQAVAADPTFARAYSGLADCYAMSDNILYGPIRTSEAMNKARYNARMALELDDSLAEAHTSMGLVRLRYDWDWAEAEREFKRAIELNPEYAQAHFWYTSVLAARGRFDEAIRESEAARALDPYSAFADQNYARALYYARRPGEAEAYLRQKIEEKPGVPQLQHMLGYVLLQQGRIDEAIAIFEKLPPERRLYSAAALGYSYGRAGREEDALRMIGELDEFSRQGVFVPPFEKALIYIGMNRRDEAFALLNESYDLRTPNLTVLAVEPAFDVIRDDPRFADLTRRLNLTP